MVGQGGLGRHPARLHLARPGHRGDAAARSAPEHRRPPPMSIELWTWNTPNGRKISVALEEMGLPYTVKPVNIGKGEQFQPDFLRISPNNRIPAIIDSDGPGGAPISIFESGAILIYLGEKTGRFWPKGDMRRQVPVLEWLMWQMGVWADARPGPPFPAGEGRSRPPLRARALHEGDAPALRRLQ